MQQKYGSMALMFIVLHKSFLDIPVCNTEVFLMCMCVCLPLSRPIESQKKTFEELLEEQLRLEEQRLKSVQQQQVRE